MRRSPLLIVGVLIAADYGLWTWSLAASSTTVGLLAGLALPPLAVVALWLAARELLRAAGRVALRRAHQRSERPPARRGRRRSATMVGSGAEEPLATGTVSSSSPPKIAA